MKIVYKKLYELPNNTYFKCVSETMDPPDPTTYKFHHVDGMYSYCTDCNDNVFHFAAWTHVEESTKDDFNIGRRDNND